MQSEGLPSFLQGVSLCAEASFELSILLAQPECWGLYGGVSLSLVCLLQAAYDIGIISTKFSSMTLSVTILRVYNDHYYFSLLFKLFKIFPFWIYLLDFVCI